MYKGAGSVEVKMDETVNKPVLHKKVYYEMDLYSGNGYSRMM